jgi:uncharacterized protein
VGDTEFHQNPPGFDRPRVSSPVFRAEDVVTASLAALRLGDVLCSPGLEDPASSNSTARASVNSWPARSPDG